MFNSGTHSGISFERELCDCNCVMFDKKVQNNRYGGTDDRETAQDFNGSRNSLSGSTEQFSKKISISEVKRRKVRKDDRQKQQAANELKHLLSDSHSEIKLSQKESWNNLTPKMASVSTQDNLRRSLQVWEKIGQNPQAKDVVITKTSQLELNVLPKKASELSMEQRVVSKVYLPKTASTQIKQTLNSSHGNQFYHAATVNRSTQQQYVRQPQKVFFKSRQVVHPVQIHHKTAIEANQPTFHPAISPFTHEDPVVGVDCENDESLSNNSVQQNTVEQRKSIKSIEVQSRYERTVQRNDGERSSKGQFSAKFAPMKFKHIVSVPGSEYPDFCEQDSIVIDHFTPVPHGPHIFVQNRFSEPPQLPKEELEYLKTLVGGGEVSAFQLDRFPQSAAKTQRPTVAHEND